jgi:predicted nucleic acid-binding protein
VTRRPRRLYADSSALVKLLVAEPETTALRRYLAASPFELVTSALARVEVHRAAKIADPQPDTPARAEQLLGGCVLVDVREPLLRRAAELTSPILRSLDAVHLATAAAVDPDVVLAYDDRLAEAARGQGLEVVQPRS